MSDFMDKDDDFDAAFVCIMIPAATLLNLYDELSKCCMKRTLRVWVNLRNCVLHTGLFEVAKRLLMRPLLILRLSPL